MRRRVVVTMEVKCGVLLLFWIVVASDLELTVRAGKLTHNLFKTVWFRIVLILVFQSRSNVLQRNFLAKKKRVFKSKNYNYTVPYYNSKEFPNTAAFRFWEDGGN